MHLMDEQILNVDENVLMVNYLLLIVQLLIEIVYAVDMFHKLENENIQHQKMILLLH
jgi:hypothetical protein